MTTTVVDDRLLLWRGGKRGLGHFSHPSGCFAAGRGEKLNWLQNAILAPFHRGRKQGGNHPWGKTGGFAAGWRDQLRFCRRPVPVRLVPGWCPECIQLAATPSSSPGSHRRPSGISPSPGGKSHMRPPPGAYIPQEDEP